MYQPLLNESSSKDEHEDDRDHDVLDSSALHEVTYYDPNPGPGSDDDSKDGDEGMTLAQLVEHHRTQREL